MRVATRSVGLGYSHATRAENSHVDECQLPNFVLYFRWTREFIPTACSPKPFHREDRAGTVLWDAQAADSCTNAPAGARDFPNQFRRVYDRPVDGDNHIPHPSPFAMFLHTTLIPLALGLLGVAESAQSIGKQLPSTVPLEDFAQTKARSYDDFLGRAVLIEFFAYW